MGGVPITAREQEVLALLGDHLTHEEIGRRLFISARTVESHVASLRRKLGLPDHRGLVRYAVEHRRPPRAPLPVALTPLVGRRAELAGLLAAVASARLISLVGPGGAGKTRLALAAAAAVDAYWVDLVPVTPRGPGVDGLVNTVAEVVAAGCGIVPSSRGPVAAVATGLRQRPGLLVLDNCEHVADAVSILTEQLIAGCPDLTVLTTGRRRLAVPHERVVTLGGLPAEEAVELFAARAVSAGAPESSAVLDRDRVARVCAVLGGLPLAIELAAVRLPALGLDGVEDGLTTTAALLHGGSRATTRHRSMEQTLDWSVTLLDRLAVTTLARLGVFVTPFAAGAAADVAGFPPLPVADVRAALGTLTEHHLVLADDDDAAEPRTYRLLEPVRQYALSRLDADDQPVFARHLDWCRRALTQHPGAAGPVVDEARAALSWAADRTGRPGTGAPAGAAELARELGLLLYRDGSLAEAQHRLQQAADFEPDDRVAAACLARAAAVAKCQVHGEEAMRLELAAADVAGRAGDGNARALALTRVAELLGRFPGMFADGALPSPVGLAADATRSAPGDRLVAAARAVAGAGYASDPAGAAAAYAAAVAVGDPLLVSAALDARCAAAVTAGDIGLAHRLAQDRLARLGSGWDEPAAGLELKDALHVAIFCAVGAGRLDAATAMAVRQRGLPFLRGRRDLADDELIAPAALAGRWPEVFEPAERFLADWNGAGRPRAAGRGLAPAAVALACGLRGDEDGRARWLDVLADIRAVPAGRASRGTGYGELFDAMVLLHQERASDALDVLTHLPVDSLYTGVFRQWIAAVRAESAVLARSSRAGELLRDALRCTAGNPVAEAMTARAAACAAGDPGRLSAVAADLRAAGAPYQAGRTELLAGRLPG